MSDRKPFPWPAGQTAAVSLTYDDANASHYELVGPTLEAAGLRGTFYISVAYMLRAGNQEQFAGLARAGHELGNHTMFHPCRIDSDSGWKPHWNLNQYSLPMWCGEVDAANSVLTMLDGQTERTYGNTCHNNTVGPLGAETCIDSAIEKRFVAGRGNGGVLCDPWTRPLANLGTGGGDNKTLDELIAEVQTALDANAWRIFCFHDVGEGNDRLRLDREIHEQFVTWLAERKDQIWTAPVVEIARHVREVRNLPYRPGSE